VRVEIEPGIRLFFDTVGGGLAPTDAAMIPKPTLLLLHGGPGFDHTSFRPWFDRFADTHQVVYFDHRAQGRSDGAGDRSQWTLDTWADDVARFCAALGIERPVLLGNSFGGFVAMHAAARYPDLADRLVLMSTAARPHYDTTAARFEALGGPEAADAYRRVYVEQDGAPEAWMDYAAKCLPLYNRRPSPFAPDRGTMNFAVVADSVRWFADYDLRTELGTVIVPTLVLAGEDDPMTPVEAAEEILACLPAGVGRLERFAECGHGTHHDQSERTEAVLREFFA
jgi:pimeloyl-ACP methyl ester carboxylesterase